MALPQTQPRPQQTYLSGQGAGRGGPSGLAEVLDVLLDKGLVIDAFVRVSVVGIELLTIDARVVVASVDTYLRFAEAVNRLDLLQAGNAQSLGDLGGGSSKALSSRSSRPRHEEPKADADEPEDEEPEDEAQPAASAEPDEGQQDDDKGILTRIKERGQVF
jgi:gas vesicle structural protein